MDHVRDHHSPATSERRALLRAALLGGGLTAAASVVASATPASAADGDPLILGATNTSSTGTVWNNPFSDQTLLVNSDGGGVTVLAGIGDAVRAIGTTGSGVYGRGGSLGDTYGVYGENFSNSPSTGGGVGGFTNRAAASGVRGEGNGPARAGVHGVHFAEDREAYGVLGLTQGPLTRAVFGWSQHARGGTGVFGQTDGSAGAGIRGMAFDGAGRTGRYGTGIIGQSGYRDPLAVAARPDTAILGDSRRGTAIRAQSALGTALDVAGRVRLSRSGIAVIPRRRLFVDVSVPGGLTARSIVHATLADARPGVAISSAVVNPRTGRVRITLTRIASTARPTRIGWIVTET